MLFLISIALSLIALSSPAPQYGYSYDARQTTPFAGGHHAADKYLPPPATIQTPLVRKQFYSVSAAEDNERQQINKHFVLGRPQRNYRVVFIKAPASSNAKVKYSAEYAPQEEKTVIYVLSKKDSELDASDIATPAPSQASKPEVFFIKYKTSEEALAAQKEIQNEYAKLEGANEYSDEGVAQVTSVVGSLDSLTREGSYDYQGIEQTVKSQENVGVGQYLPPVTK